MSTTPGYPRDTRNLLEFEFCLGNSGTREFNWSSWKFLADGMATPVSLGNEESGLFVIFMLLEL